MSEFFLRAFAIGASLLVVGCTSNTPVALQTTPIALAEPSPGAGQIVFFRPAAFVGAAVRCTVRENGKMIVRIRPRRYFIAPAEPGTHVFTATTEATDTLTTEVAPNATAYVKCTIRMGILIGRPNLSASSTSEFTKMSAGLKPEDSKKIAAEIAADEAERAKNTTQSPNQ